MNLYKCNFSFVLISDLQLIDSFTPEELKYWSNKLPMFLNGLHSVMCISNIFS